MNNPYMELASAIVDREDWRDQAACITVDPELFYVESHGETHNRRQIANAKAVCATCPVAIQCLDYATRTRQTHGVWGGRNMGAGRSHHGERTHCKNGHEFLAENTVIATNAAGYEFRRCVACYKAKSQRYAAAKRVSA